MDEEIKNYIKVWIFAIASLIYCYFIPSKIPEGKIRFLSLLPVFYLFTVLPLNLTTIFFGGNSAFFLVWLGNFKLLLFSFGLGPLSSQPSISLPYFIFIASFPIKITNKENPYNKKPKSPINLALKVLILTLLSAIYEYKHQVHPNVMLVYYCCYLYLALELGLAMFAFMAATFLGLGLEPQFDEPYLSTSLQDFWGRRWNLMVTNILRPTVYEPSLQMTKKVLDKKWAPLPAMFVTFMVSGLMHELIFFYLGRVSPTWEVTLFFAVQGFCVALEVVVKKMVKDRWRLHRGVSGPLAIGFVMVTGFWLFFPPLLRCNLDVRVRREMIALLDFLKGLGSIGASLRAGSTSAAYYPINHFILGQ